MHPNHAEKHDPTNHPRPGGGPLLKVSANQRYMTEARGEAVFGAACAAAGVPFQPFVNVNTIPGGSTIGPLAATRLGIPTVDVGVGLLSMHSARELVHVDDLAALHGAVAAFLAGAGGLSRRAVAGRRDEHRLLALGGGLDLRAERPQRASRARRAAPP